MAYETIQELAMKLNDLKKFEAGHTSRNQNEMLIKHEGKVLKLSLEELGEGEMCDYMDKL